MWMTATQIALYPTFAAYVRESMPTCKTVPRIVKALATYGGLNEFQAREALSWGHMPLVRVVDLWDDAESKSEGNGGFDPRRPYEIHIAEHRVNQFETVGAGGTDVNATGARVFIVGATMLHEICHWGLHRMGIAETDEAGRAFEQAVYGKQID